jgi:hypothetical protein
MNLSLTGWYWMELGSGWVFSLAPLGIRVYSSSPYKGICEIKRLVESKVPGTRCEVKIHDGGLIYVYTTARGTE